jgi:uncharacterized membrane-anchored protein YhcB (DUF1043 family)
MTNTTDVHLQAISRSLGMLTDLMQTSEVRATIAVFRADFLAASQQIDVLSDYKDLHDLLHRLQFECYVPFERQASSFPHEENVLEAFTDHEVTFREIVISLQEVNGRSAVAEQLTWVARLAKAEELLHQALEAKDSDALRDWCHLVRRVLDRYPSRVNTRLNEAARAIRMDAIGRAMTTILDMLRERDAASAEVTTFAAGVASLTELNQRLTCLVRDHDRWQDVDVELRRVEATLSSDPEEPGISWPDIKALTMPLMCGEDESQFQALSQYSANLEEALQADDPEKARYHFRRFQRQVAWHFYRVDTELKSLCGKLRTIGKPLADVSSQVVGPVDGGTPAQRRHLLRLLDELARKYEALTKRIAALDGDIVRELDSERKLVLTERKDELAAEREKLVELQVQIEDQLKKSSAA